MPAIDFHTALNNLTKLYLYQPQKIYVKQNAIYVKGVDIILPFKHRQSNEKINFIREQSAAVFQAHAENLIKSLKTQRKVSLLQTENLDHLKIMLVQSKVILQKSSANWMPILKEFHSSKVQQNITIISKQIDDFEGVKAKWDLKYPITQLFTVLKFAYRNASFSDKSKNFPTPEYLIYAPLISFARDLAKSNFPLTELIPFLNAFEKNNLDLLIEIMQFLKGESEGQTLNSSLKKQLHNAEWVKHCTPDRVNSSERHHIKTIKRKKKKPIHVELVFCYKLVDNERTIFSSEEKVKVSAKLPSKATV